MNYKGKGRGRPATTPIKFMDGFYLEVRNKGSVSKGVIVRNATLEGMTSDLQRYKRGHKDVTVLGEHKDFQWVDTPKKKEKAAKVKKVA